MRVIPHGQAQSCKGPHRFYANPLGCTNLKGTTSLFE